MASTSLAVNWPWWQCYMSSTAMYMSFVADVNLQPQITGTTFLLVSRRELYYMSLPVRL